MSKISKRIDDNEFMCLFDQNLTAKEVAANLGVSLSSVYAYVRKQDLKFTSISSRRHEQLIEQLRPLAKSGMSLADMSAATGIPYSNVRALLVRYDVEFKRLPVGNVMGDKTKAIIEALKTAATHREVARQFNVTHQYIACIISRYKVPTPMLGTHTRAYKVREMYKQGKSVEEISEAINDHRYNVRQVLGLERGQRTDDENIEIVRKSAIYLREKGTLEGCAETLGITHTALIRMRSTYSKHARLPKDPLPDLIPLNFAQKIAAYLKCGYKNVEIAKALNSKTTTIATTIYANKLRPTKTKSKAVPLNQRTDIVKHVLYCRSLGHQMDVLLDEIGINRSTYDLWLREYRKS